VWGDAHKDELCLFKLETVTNDTKQLSRDVNVAFPAVGEILRRYFTSMI